MPTTRTPEGFPSKCPLCGADVSIDYSDTDGDAPCPCCGVLLIQSSQRVEFLRSKFAAVLGVRDETTLDQMPLEALGGSLDLVELIMELEEDFDANLPDEELSEMKTLGDLFRLFAKYPRN